MTPSERPHEGCLCILFRQNLTIYICRLQLHGHATHRFRNSTNTSRSGRSRPFCGLSSGLILAVIGWSLSVADMLHVLPGQHLMPKAPELAQTQSCENFVELFHQSEHRLQGVMRDM